MEQEVLTIYSVELLNLIRDDELLHGELYTSSLENQVIRCAESWEGMYIYEEQIRTTGGRERERV